MHKFVVDVAHPATLIDYLRYHKLISIDEMPEIAELGGGVSSTVVLVRRSRAANLVVKQALEKLRVAVDWYCDPARILREAAGMKILAKICPQTSIVPLLLEDPEEHVIVMAAVSEPHKSWKEILLGGKIEASHFKQSAKLLAGIHSAFWMRKDAVPAALHDRSYFEVLRIEPYYSYTAEQEPEVRNFMRDLTAETRATQVALVHGDYSPKNLLISGERMILLDHEVIHYGDPAFDIGFLTAHLLSKGHHVQGHRIELIQAGLLHVEQYSQALGDVPQKADLEKRAVRQTLGCLLARVKGRSTLEYLGTEERRRQRNIVLEMIRLPPLRMADLILDFDARLQRCLVQP